MISVSGVNVRILLRFQNNFDLKISRYINWYKPIKCHGNHTRRKREPWKRGSDLQRWRYKILSNAALKQVVETFRENMGRPRLMKELCRQSGLYTKRSVIVYNMTSNILLIERVIEQDWGSKVFVKSLERTWRSWPLQLKKSLLPFGSEKLLRQFVRFACITIWSRKWGLSSHINMPLHQRSARTQYWLNRDGS